MYSTVWVWPIAVRTFRLKNTFRMGHIFLIIIEEFDRNGRVKSKIQEKIFIVSELETAIFKGKIY